MLYCHLPASEMAPLLLLVLLSAVIAMPAEAPLSTSATEPASRSATLITSLASERTAEGSLMVVDSSQLGASFTAVTLMLAVLLAIEKAVLPPVSVVVTLLPAVPLLWSQAR